MRHIGQLLFFSLLLFVVTACGQGKPIPMGPGANLVPKFIGAPATAKPLTPIRIPSHPFLAAQGQNGMHSDSYASGSYPWSGPLGNSPRVRSASLGILGGLVATVSIDSNGRLICVKGDFSGFELLLMDPVTLKVLARHSLPQRASMSEFWRTLDMNVIMSDTSGGAYFHLDNQDRPIIGNADNIIQIFRVDDSGASPQWQVVEQYDLRPYLPKDSYVTDAMPDWDGRIWFVTRTGIVGVVKPSTGEVHQLQLAGEEIQNAIAAAEDGIYIVSDHAMYRFQADSKNVPQWIWRQEYDRGTSIKPGSINQGSGTTPTLLDVPQDGSNPVKLVAITDNADIQVNVVAYKRLTGEKVCQHPVFDPGYSVSENSLIGYGRSFIVENNYRYGTGSPLDPNPRNHPGITRIDMNEACTDCEFIWESREASQTTVPKLSIGNGLIYLYTRLDGTPDNIMAWYLTTLDFETGDTVYKIFTGTGILWNNSYAPITLSPDGTVYVGVFNGIISVRDGS